MSRKNYFEEESFYSHTTLGVFKDSETKQLIIAAKGDSRSYYTALKDKDQLDRLIKALQDARKEMD